jgi:hypothetical protein
VSLPTLSVCSASALMLLSIWPPSVLVTFIELSVTWALLVDSQLETLGMLFSWSANCRVPPAVCHLLTTAEAPLLSQLVMIQSNPQVLSEEPSSSWPTSSSWWSGCSPLLWDPVHPPLNGLLAEPVRGFGCFSVATEEEAEDGSSMFLWNISVYLQAIMMLLLRRRALTSLPLEPQISRSGQVIQLVLSDKVKLKVLEESDSATIIRVDVISGTTTCIFLPMASSQSFVLFASRPEWTVLNSDGQSFLSWPSPCCVT